MGDDICVLLASSEATPLAQTGGLAEVAGSLPQALTRAGLPSLTIIPGYTQAIKKGDFSPACPELSVSLGPDQVPFTLLKGELPQGGAVYLIRNDAFFDRPHLYGEGRLSYEDNPERFAFFSKAVVASLPYLERKPDILLANDWQTGLIMPLLLEAGPDAPKGVFVIHNQGFLGLAPTTVADVIGLPDGYYGVEGLEYYGQLSFLKAGIVYSKAVVTVSPSYAKEILTPEGGNGLDGVLRRYSGKLSGIINGVDHNQWNPQTDPYIPRNYSSTDLSGKAVCKNTLKSRLQLRPSNRPLFGMVSRLTAQKGFSLIVEGAQEIFKLGLDLVILGTGEPWFEKQLTEMVEKYPDNMRLLLDFDIPLSHKVIAASDFSLVPSLYEPCGLIQLYSLRYGTIPVVRAIGGLNDTVRDYAGQNPDGLWDSGFKFSQFQAGALVRAIRRATELYNRKEDFTTMAKSDMEEDFSWNRSAKDYAKLFESVLKGD
ncbi:MAG: glycogen synthase GlgA [Deltaproteobacteria bacterium]|jgi:starch synthase|nr:glycogen synthase GlgA [Deltaproteobacteria bacterium]